MSTLFIEFDEQIDRSMLKGPFYDDLEMFSTMGDNTCGKILSLLQSNNKNLLLSFRTSSQLDKNCILVIIHSMQDFLLNKLAKDCNFPRGFPIIWNKNVSMHFYGFYPKFENDDRVELMTESSVFQNISQINFNYKYSGFLGQIIPFVHNGVNHYTTCSKNSTANRFSKDLHRIAGPKITHELVERMINENLHICGEVMSKFDQAHGSIVQEEEFIITMLAMGHDVKITSGDSLESVIKMQGNQFDEQSNRTIIQFKSQEEMLNFSVENGLSVDSIFNVKNVSCEQNCTAFLIALNQNRNFMTMERLETLIKASGTISSIPGTITHSNILGNVLEGLIIKIIYNDLSVKTVKFKFPFYTIRTMLLRNMFGNLFQNEQEDNAKKISDYLATLKLTDNLTEYASVTKKYVDWWVINNLSDRDYWLYVCALINQNFVQIKEKYVKEIQEFLFGLKITDTFENIIPIVGFHIYLMNEVARLKEFEFVPTVNYMELANKIIPYSAGRSVKYESVTMELSICFVFGPIGSGKSTVGDFLSKQNPCSLHIDGDKLDLDLESVLKLSTERTDYSRFQMLKCLSEGKIPIYSAGGGIFTDLNFPEYFKNIFHNSAIKLNFTVIIMANVSQPQEVTPLTFNLNSAVKSLYDDNVKLKSAMLQRGWKTPGLYDKLVGINANNFTIVEKLVGKLNISKIFLFPSIDSSNYDLAKINLQVEQLRIEGNPIQNTAIYFNQWRILVKYVLEGKECFHHITIEFSKENSIEFNKQLNNDFDLKLRNVSVVGQLHTIKANQIANVVKLIVIEIKGTGDKELDDFIARVNQFAHVTISPSAKHMPSDMRTIAEGIKSKQSNVQLVDKSSKEKIDYPTSGNSKPINVELVSMFWI